MTAPKKKSSTTKYGDYSAAARLAAPTLPKKSQLKDPVETVIKSEDGYNVKVKYGEFVEHPVDAHGIELGHYMDELDKKGMVLPRKKKKSK